MIEYDKTAANTSKQRNEARVESLRRVQRDSGRL